MGKNKIQPSPTMGNPVIPKPEKDSSDIPLHGFHQHAMEKMALKTAMTPQSRKPIVPSKYKTIPKP